MMVMRKILYGLLILIMLTPGLVCGPFMGMDKAQAAQPMPGMEDCKGMGTTEGAPAGDHIFFKDCSKVDLQTADYPASLKTPDISGKTYTVAWTAIVPAYDFTPSAANAIRGPPPDWPAFSQNQPSIILTTQRFRI